MFRLAVLVSGLFFPSCHLSTSIFCSAARPLLLLRLRPRPTPTTAMDMALVATEDTEDMVLATAVDTPPLDTLDLATLVVTTASVRLMLRLIPTTDTDTPDLAMDVDTDTPDTPPLDTPDSATEATDTPVATTASVRLRPSLRLMLRLIPTTDLDTLASGATEDMVLATAVDTPALDTPDSATPVDTSEDMATATAVVTDTTVRLTQPKDQHNAGAQLSPELASVSALSYLTAGYYLATKESKLK